MFGDEGSGSRVPTVLGPHVGGCSGGISNITLQQRTDESTGVSVCVSHTPNPDDLPGYLNYPAKDLSCVQKHGTPLDFMSHHHKP